MNPIYRFELSANGTTIQAKPVWKDDLAKDFEKESGEQFFRAKLSGKLTFQRGDYSFIVSAAFDTQFALEIFISYNGGQTWTSYWSGTFWKTDCEFDGDSGTVIVSPTVSDQYNDVLAGLEKEYNLIELAPEIVSVRADKRPMIQVYVPGQNVIGCFLSGMWWEQECEPESDITKLTLVGDGKLNFALNKTQRVIRVLQKGTPDIPDVFMGSADSQFFVSTGIFEIRLSNPAQGVTQWTIVRLTDNVAMWVYNQQSPVPTPPYEMTLTPVSGSGATGNVVVSIDDISVYCRYITDVNKIGDQPTFTLPDDDIVENNRNYSRVVGYYFPDCVVFSQRLTETPNQWGIYQPGLYYMQPYSITGQDFFPVARNGWGRVSIWFTFFAFDWVIEESARKSFVINNVYPLSSVISVLLGKIAPGITHDATTDYSAFLYGTNILGIDQTLMITPKSNIITAGYDQPAQKAPITLRDVLNMLRDCFRCYWFIDSNNRFRIEHIQYFRNGGSYSGTPVVGTDLTKQTVSRNGKRWAFARDQYKFDKPEMAARYQFGWMDDVTQLFEGFPIDILSKYVNPDFIEQIQIGKFTSDIDYILLNPSAISKDGFVLLGAIWADNKIAGTLTTGKFINTSGGISSHSKMKMVEFTNIDPTKPYQAKNFGLPSSGYSGVPMVNYFNGSTYLGRDPQFPTQGPFNYNTWQTLNIPGNCDRIVINSNTEYPDPQLSLIPEYEYALPYLNYLIDGNNHYLQNAYVAFCILQDYYKYDMPGLNYEINGVQKVATGVKRLKNQSLRFPMLNDPNLVQLIKTNLGNGIIEKISINLSSRNATATLKYDTE